jgi:hypothetical protein
MVTFIVLIVEYLFLPVTNNIISKHLLNIAEMLTTFILNNVQALCCSVVTKLEPEPELLGTRICQVVQYTDIF